MRDVIIHNIEEPSDFDVDWTGLLAPGETITKSSWFLDHDSRGVLKIKGDNAETTASVRVRGGIPHCQHLLANEIHTSAGNHHRAEYWLTIGKRDNPKVVERPTPKAVRR